MTAVSDAVVRLDAVSKHYGRVKAVDALSLDIRQGEILTLLGPSGCGKTSTLRMVIGLERCSSGVIHHRGAPVDDPQRKVFVPAHKRNMGMVFQSYAIWPHMTVGENVAFGLRVRGLRGQGLRDKVSQALELVGLDGFESRPATALSGGQQQRVALARSLVFEPDMLLLDEPFSNLDAKLREQMRVEVKVLQRRLGMTVLFVTHDQIEALSLSDRVAVMHQGRIAQAGTPEDLYRRPASPLVRDFLGKILLLDGTVIDKRGETIVVGLRNDPRHTIRAPRSSDLQVGQACQVAVRPEHAVIERDQGAAASPAENSVSGIIEAMLFLGDRYEAQVRLPWHQTIVVGLPAESALSEGSAVRIVLPEDKVQTWRA